MPHWPWQPLSSHGRHGASLLVPLHTTISQHSGRLLSAVAPGVGHHGGRCWPFRSWCIDRRCGFLLGKLASKHAPTNHGGRLPSRQLDSIHAKLVDSLRQPIWDIMAAWCLVVVVANSKNRARRQGFLHNAILCIDWWWWSPSLYDRHGAPLPAFKYTTISQHTMRQIGIVKTRKNYHY